MNKIYKVVWSKAKQSYVVASEFAHSCTKGTGRASRSAAVLAAFVLTMGVAGISQAAAPDGNTSAAGENPIAIGTGSRITKNSDNAIAIGTNAAATKDEAVAFGASAYARGEDSIAIGAGTVVDGNKSVGIGYRVQADGNDAVALGCIGKSGKSAS